MPEDEETKPTPTKPSAWSNETDVELPSGNLVRVRRPTLYIWYKTGQLSQETKATVEKVANDKRSETSFEQRQEAMAELLCKTVIEPVWSLTPREDAVCIDDVCDSDRAFLALRMDISL